MESTLSNAYYYAQEGRYIEWRFDLEVGHVVREHTGEILWKWLQHPHLQTIDLVVVNYCDVGFGVYRKMLGQAHARRGQIDE